jgi:hypothetical protein
MLIGEGMTLCSFVAVWCILGLSVPPNAGAAERDAGLTEAQIEKHAVIKSDRPDGRYVSGRGFTQYLMKHTQPRLRFDLGFSVMRWEAWQLEVRMKMGELMDSPPVVEQPRPKKLATTHKEGYRVEKWESYPEPGSVVPFLMLVPDGVDATNPAPAVMCFPGSTRSKEGTAGEPELHPRFRKPRHEEPNKMGSQYARAGFVSVVVDNPGVAETSDLERLGMAPDYDRNAFSAQLLNLGRNYLELSVFQKMDILRWLKNQAFVDRKRIALSGHSLGTEPLMVMGVLDPEIAAFVFNDFLSPTLQRAIVNTKPDSRGRRPPMNWIGHRVPGIWKWFDFPDIVASLAPRPLIITEGGPTHALETVRASYRLVGAQEQLAVHYYPKYSDPSARHDGEPIPEGLNRPSWFEYANVDAPEHHFKGHLAVPWLVRSLKP